MPQFLAKMTRTGGTLEPPVFCGANGIAFIVFAALCLFLVFPAPLLLRFVDVSHPQEAFLPGSRLQVPQGLSLANYLDRLSDYQASYPENARFFTADAGDFLLAINWNDLQTVLLPCPPAQDFSR